MNYDFSKCKLLPCDYKGSEIKAKIEFQGSYYIMKFPDPIRENGNKLSYMNNQFSEYIGSHVYQSCNIPTQETLIGTYNKDGKQKVVVLGKDFNYDGKTRIHDLFEMDDLANHLSLDRRISENLEDAYLFFDNMENLDRQASVERFWDMFVIDALIMNSDRHFHNIGYWFNDNGVLTPAPVYDCGSSLGALLSDEDLFDLLQNETDFKNTVFNTPSCYRNAGNRVFFHSLINNPTEDLKNAIIRTVPKIDLNRINNIIDNTPLISDVRKTFCKKAIQYNKEHMLDIAYKRLIKDKSLAYRIKEAKKKGKTSRLNNSVLMNSKKRGQER